MLTLNKFRSLSTLCSSEPSIASKEYPRFRNFKICCLIGKRMLLDNPSITWRRILVEQTSTGQMLSRRTGDSKCRSEWCIVVFCQMVISYDFQGIRIAVNRHVQTTFEGCKSGMIQFHKARSKYTIISFHLDIQACATLGITAISIAHNIEARVQTPNVDSMPSRQREDPTWRYSKLREPALHSLRHEILCRLAQSLDSLDARFIKMII